MCQKTVFVVDRFSVKLILLSSAPQKTVFAADSFFSAPIFTLSAGSLFLEAFRFSWYAFCRSNLTKHFWVVSVSLCCLSASLRPFKCLSYCAGVSTFYCCLSPLRFLKCSLLSR